MNRSQGRRKCSARSSYCRLQQFNPVKNVLFIPQIWPQKGKRMAFWGVNWSKVISDVKLKIEFSQRIDLKKTENFKPHKQGHQHFGHLSIILATFKRLFWSVLNIVFIQQGWTWKMVVLKVSWSQVPFGSKNTDNFQNNSKNWATTF